MLVGWEGRHATEEEAAMLMLSWEIQGLFNPSDFDIVGGNAILCRHAPVFSIMPQIPSYPEGFALGRVRGQVAEEAIWAEFVYTAKKISVATLATETKELLGLWETLDMLAEYKFETTLMRCTLKSHMRRRHEEMTRRLATIDPKKKEELMMEKVKLGQQQGELMACMEEVDRQPLVFDEASMSYQRVHDEFEQLGKVLAG